MAKKKRVSQKEFIASDGNICPKCRGEDISWGELEINGNEVQQMGRCGECGNRFIAYYILKGFFKLEEN